MWVSVREMRSRLSHPIGGGSSGEVWVSGAQAASLGAAQSVRTAP